MLFLPKVQQFSLINVFDIQSEDMVALDSFVQLYSCLDGIGFCVLLSLSCLMVEVQTFLSRHHYVFKYCPFHILSRPPLKLLLVVCRTFLFFYTCVLASPSCFPSPFLTAPFWLVSQTYLLVHHFFLQLCLIYNLTDCVFNFTDFFSFLEI